MSCRKTMIRHLVWCLIVLSATLCSGCGEASAGRASEVRPSGGPDLKTEAGFQKFWRSTLLFPVSEEISTAPQWNFVNVLTRAARRVSGATESDVRSGLSALLRDGACLDDPQSECMHVGNYAWILDEFTRSRNPFVLVAVVNRMDRLVPRGDSCDCDSICVEGAEMRFVYQSLPDRKSDESSWIIEIVGGPTGVSRLSPVVRALSAALPGTSGWQSAVTEFLKLPVALVRLRSISANGSNQWTFQQFEFRKSENGRGQFVQTTLSGQVVEGGCDDSLTPRARGGRTTIQIGEPPIKKGECFSARSSRPDDVTKFVESVKEDQLRDGSYVVPPHLATFRVDFDSAKTSCINTTGLRDQDRERRVRRRFALNQCSGCHGAETGTMLRHLHKECSSVEISGFLEKGASSPHASVCDNAPRPPGKYQYSELYRRALFWVSFERLVKDQNSRLKDWIALVDGTSLDPLDLSLTETDRALLTDESAPEVRAERRFRPTH